MYNNGSDKIMKLGNKGHRNMITAIIYVEWNNSPMP